MQFGREIIDERTANIEKEPSGHDDDRVYAWSLAELFDCILDFLNRESVEKLILGDDDGESTTQIILSDGRNVWDTVAFILNGELPGEKVISTKIIDHALKMNELQSLVPRKRYSGGFMSISLLLVHHGSDEQLRQFVDLILIPEDNGNIWIDFLSQYGEMKRGGKRRNEEECWKVDLFLRCVKNKLGDTIVQRLVRKDIIESTGKPELASVLEKYANDE